MRPDFRENQEFTIHDPACGTGGFLIGAYEWIMSQTKEGALLTDKEKMRLQEHTFSGAEIVLETKRLALMNLYLHEIVTDIYYGDSLAEGPRSSKRYDCVLTNPPFGTKGGGDVPNREDFTVATSNKQLNFVQHVMHILKPGGRAAMVVPDNVLFESGAGKKIRQILMEDCDLHTILRLPIGTFSPYSPGVKANIIFFRKGLKTEAVWIYDLRTNIEKVTKGHPLTADYFTEFEKSYGTNHDGHPIEGRQETERFKRFSRQDIMGRDENLDIFWLRDESLESGDNLPDPETIVSEIRTQLQTAQDVLDELMLILENGRGDSNV